MQKFLIGFVVAVVLAAGAWWFTASRSTAPAQTPEAPESLPPPAAAEPAPPKNEEAVKALGEGLDLQLGREPEKALEKFDQALAKDAQLKGVRYQMAVAAYQAGDLPKATQAARECIAGGENVADAHILLGTMAAREGRHDEASAEFAAAVAADPANAIAYYNWSESLRHAGKSGEALEKLSMAMSRNPGEPLYALKQRLARIEAADGVDQLVTETLAQVQLDPPAGDWLLTAAAIDLSRGQNESASRMLEGARRNMQPILFVGILQEDPFFKKYRENPAVAPFLDVSIKVNRGADKPQAPGQP
jgi:tetratricopeptide (TPR) repeat protein